MSTDKTKDKPLISVVVLNWNGKRFIDDFMTSVKGQVAGRFNIEVIFTDNASSDNSVDYYKKKYYDGELFKLVLNDNNYGYAKGNNLGIKQANGDYILVCNNDLVLDKNLITELYNIIRTHECDLVVPKLMFKNKPGIINNAGSILKRNDSWPIHEIGIHESDNNQYSKVREISAFCGACVLFKRSFFEEVGMYDEKFFMYFEDGDLSWRGQDAGKKFCYAPKAVSYHVHTGSSKEGSPLFMHYVYRNRMLVLIKNAGPRTILKGIHITLNDFFILRTKKLVGALLGRRSKKDALLDFYRGQKIIWAVALYTPYCLMKRGGLMKEHRL